MQSGLTIGDHTNIASSKLTSLLEDGKSLASSLVDIEQNPGQMVESDQQLKTLTKERGRVHERKEQFEDDKASIEREIKMLERVERNLDRRIAQLKQVNFSSGSIDLVV
jgi:hypothetical protein